MEIPASDTGFSAADGTTTPAPQTPDPCDCFVRLYELLSAPKQPTLHRAELFIYTGLPNEVVGKDDTTGIYITVQSADGKSLLASLADGANGIGWNPGGGFFWPLVVEAPGATRASCEEFTVKLYVQTRQPFEVYGEIRITLYFSDGTTLVAEREQAWEEIQPGAWAPLVFASP